MAFRAIPAAVQVISTSFTNLGTAFRMSWPWLAVLLPLLVFFGMAANASGAMQNPEALQGLLYIGILLVVIYTVATCSIAVNWHRFLLLGEEAEGWDRLRIDMPVWRYLGNGILLGLLIALPAILIMTVFMMLWVALFVPGESAEPGPGFELGSFIATLVPLAMVYRLGIKFPAIALERDDYGFSDGWGDTKGYFLRIIGFTALLGFVTYLPTAVLPTNWFGIAPGNSVLVMLGVAALAVWSWVVMIIGITTLTMLYAIFVEGAEV